MNDLYLSFINFYNSNLILVDILFYGSIGSIVFFVIYLIASLGHKFSSLEKNFIKFYTKLNFVFFIPIIVIYGVSFTYVKLPDNSCIIKTVYADTDVIKSQQWLLSKTAKELEQHQSAMALAKKVNASNYEDLVAKENELIKTIERYNNELSTQEKYPQQKEFLVLGQIDKETYTILSSETRSVDPYFKLTYYYYDLLNPFGNYAQPYTYQIGQKCSEKITNLAHDLKVVVTNKK